MPQLNTRAFSFEDSDVDVPVDASINHSITQILDPISMIQSNQMQSPNNHSFFNQHLFNQQPSLNQATRIIMGQGNLNNYQQPQMAQAFVPNNATRIIMGPAMNQVNPYANINNGYMGTPMMNQATQVFSPLWNQSQAQINPNFYGQQMAQQVAMAQCGNMGQLQQSMNQNAQQLQPKEKSKDFLDFIKRQNTVHKEDNLKSKLNRTLLPKFYLKELRSVAHDTLLITIIFLASIALLGFVLYNCLWIGVSYWVLLPQVTLNVIVLGFYLLQLFKYFNFRKEAKTNQGTFSVEKPTASIVKAYRKLKVSYLNVNWLSAGTYIFCGWGILLTYIVMYFFNLIDSLHSQFGLLTIYSTGSLIPMYVVIGFGAFAGATLVSQFYILIKNNTRINRMENYYASELCDQQDIIGNKKMTNRRNMAIFFVFTFVFTFILYFVYVMLKRKAKVK